MNDRIRIGYPFIIQDLDRIKDSDLFSIAPDQRPLVLENGWYFHQSFFIFLKSRRILCQKELIEITLQVDDRFMQTRRIPDHILGSVKKFNILFNLYG